MEKKTAPRGLRNNNPLNIRKNNKTNWIGQCNKQEDRAFVQFRSMPYGYRAAFKVLHVQGAAELSRTLRLYELTTIHPALGSALGEPYGCLRKERGKNCRSQSRCPAAIAEKGKGALGEDRGRYAPR